MEAIYRIHFETKYLDVIAEEDYNFYFDIIDKHVVVFEQHRSNALTTINFDKVTYIEKRIKK